jgi:hypothetical protein
MSARTPGPWFADKLQDRNAFNVFPAGATLALLQVAGPIHDGAHPYALATEANARLIAAAPELLEALRDLVLNVNEAMRTGGWVPTPLQQSFWDSMVEAQHAIAKAEGKA